MTPFDPIRCGGYGARNYFTENNAWTYIWDVQHDLPRLRRGPLLLAKSLAVGDTEQETFCWDRLSNSAGVAPTAWTCTLTPLWNPNVWGAWYAKFTPPPEADA